MTEKEPKVSIILPVGSEGDGWLESLDSLLKGGGQVSIEIILVDDGREKQIEESNIDHPVTLIRHTSRQGAARSRNAGARVARGDWLLFWSDFLLAPENALVHWLSVAEKARCDVAKIPFQAASTASLTRFQRFLADQDRYSIAQSTAVDARHLQFNAALIKRVAFNEVKGFDEKMQHYGGHELDLAIRLQKAEKTNWIRLDEAPAIRVCSQSHAQIRKRLREYGRVGLQALLNKHPEWDKKILVYPKTWSLISGIRLTWVFEWLLAGWITMNFPLMPFGYRAYLHLLMRNAWASR